MIQKGDLDIPRRIIILPDYREILRYIEKFLETQDTADEAMAILAEKSLKIRCLGVQLDLRWVPGHSEGLGNNRANDLAR